MLLDDLQLEETLSARDRRIIVTRIVAKAHRLTMAGDDAKRWQTFKAMGYLPATPSDIKLRVFPSYIFVPMSELSSRLGQLLMHVPARKKLMFLIRHLSGCPLSKQSRNLSPRGSNLSKYVTDDRGLYEW